MLKHVMENAREQLISPIIGIAVCDEGDPKNDTLIIEWSPVMQCYVTHDDQRVGRDGDLMPYLKTAFLLMGKKGDLQTAIVSDDGIVYLNINSRHEMEMSHSALKAEAIGWSRGFDEPTKTQEP